MKINNIFIITLLLFIMLFFFGQIVGESESTIMLGNFQRTGVYQGIPVESLNKIIWQFDSKGQIMLQPLVYHEKVYFITNTKMIYCLNSKDGNIIWSKKMQQLQEVNPLIYDNILFVSADYAYMIAIDPDTGKEFWRFKTGGNIFSSPVAANGVLYFGSEDWVFYAVNEKTGTMVWSLKQPQPSGYSSNNSGFMSPCMYNEKIFVIINFYQLCCIDIDQRKFLWEAPIQSSYPICTDGKIVYVAADHDNGIFMFDVNTGKKIGVLQPLNNLHGAITLTDNTIYTTADKLYALDKITGKIKWSNDDSLGYIIYLSGYLITNNYYEGIHIVDARTGRVKSVLFLLGGINSKCYFQFSNATLYVATGKGILYAIR